MDINKLLNSKHVRTYKNKYFYCACIVENGIAEPFKLGTKVFGIRIYLPHWLRKLLRHKEKC